MTASSGVRAGWPVTSSPAIAKNHGIRWGTIRDTSVTYYDHGNGGGHFVVEGYIGKREP